MEADGLVTGYYVAFPLRSEPSPKTFRLYVVVFASTMVSSLAIYMRALITALAYGGDFYPNFPRHSAHLKKGVLP